jgi:uncharacterized protein involved in cysteine biosynthesis
MTIKTEVELEEFSYETTQSTEEHESPENPKLHDENTQMSLSQLTMLPLYAIVYFYTRPEMWAFVCCFFCLQIVILLFAIFLLFGTYVIQFQFVTNLMGVSSDDPFLFLLFLIGVFLMICVEIVIVFVILFFALAKPIMMDWLLEVVLRDHRVPWNPSGRHCCTNIVRLLFFTVLLLVVMVVTLPLNFIPILGTVLWCIANGFFVAWDLIDVYFDLKKVTFSEASRFAFSHYLEFTCFGTMCLLVTLIPVIGIFFSVTDFIAAALWAVELEKSGVVDRYKEGDDPFPNTNNEFNDIGEEQL